MEYKEFVLDKQAVQQGFYLRENDDHILELVHKGKVIARFSQTGVEVDNILKEISWISKN